MMIADARAYNITVRWGEFEGDSLFEARVKELPDLVEYAESYEEAYELAIDAIETTAAAMAERGASMPIPLEPADDFSGRVTLRISRSLHRALAEAADSEGVSLNQHLVNVLTYFSGFAAGMVSAEGKTPWQTVETEPKSKMIRRPHLRVVHSRSVDAAGGWA